jgi:starvation-inducible outer membrane lipoprotein
MMRLIVIALLALAGCASSPQAFDPSKMTAEQLAALAKDRSAVGQCATAQGLYGSGVVVWVQFDKATFPAGGAVTVNKDCSMSFAQTPPAAK